MRNRTRGVCAIMLGSALALSAAGCGKSNTGGEGSETHWLQTCDTDDDCGVGQCLCGVCTLPCVSLRDCPAPLDQCVASTPSGDSCESLVCGSSRAGDSTQALSVAEPSLTNRYPTCDDRRQTALTNIDVGFRSENFDGGPAGLVVADYPRGFLFFGGATEHFYRVSGNGELVRELPAPSGARPNVQFQSAVALEDGSLLLAGRFDARAWVGKVGPSWDTLWEVEIGTGSVLKTTVRALPDGGAVAFAASGTEFASSAEVTNVAWSRISSTGEKLWTRDFVLERGTTSLPVLAVAGDTIQIAVSQPGGVHFISSDLEGNHESALWAASPGETAPVSLEAIPGGDIVMLTRWNLYRLNEAKAVIWERGIGGEGVRGTAVALDPIRNELLMVGSHAGFNVCDECVPGGLIQSIDLNGKTRWMVVREGWPAGPVDLEESRLYASGFSDVAVDTAGNAAAMGALSSQWLSMTWVGAEACGG